MASRNRQHNNRQNAFAPSFDVRRAVDDRLPDSFAVKRSESEWLMTLLGPDELAYIFGDDHGGKAQD